MTKHADGRPEHSSGSKLRVLEGQQRSEVAIQKKKRESERTLDTYDASSLIGLKTIVHGAAIEHIDGEGETTIELPKVPELLASAAVARCLMPIRLRGSEIRAMRRIMKLTLAALAKKLDEKAAVETVSRWESEAQPMGGYAEKMLRLLVCEELRKDAPGIEYNASIIAHLRVLDPWRADAGYQVPAIELWLLPLKEQCSGTIIEAWNEKKVA